jgi:GT2 family glycosyltransferase
MTEQSRTPSVTIVMPLYGHVAPVVVVGLTALLSHSFRHGIVSDALFSEGALVDDARNQLVRRAFESNPEVSHLMWVDSDVIPPPDTVERLLAHDKEVVGGIYHQKEPPFPPLVYDLDPYRPVESSFTGGELRRVGGVGLGCALVRADVYQRISQHFRDIRWYELSYGTGEDVHFFERCRQVGIEVFVDPTVRCSHVRDQPITADDWERARRAQPRA